MKTAEKSAIPKEAKQMTFAAYNLATPICDDGDFVLYQALVGAPNSPDELGSFDEERWLVSAKEANDRRGLAYYLLSKSCAR